MRRRFTVLVTALCVTALAATAAGAQQPAAVRVGTADTTLDLLNLTLEGLPVPIESLSLAQVRSFASIDDDPTLNALGKGRPFALASVVLPGGQQEAARSDGDTGQDAKSAPLPGGVGGVTVGGMSAVADETSARALVSALSGSLSAGLAGLSAAVPNSGVVAVTDQSASTATNGAVLSGLSLGVSDLVPLEILEQLPLETLLRLVDELNLPIDLPANLDVLRGQLDQLVDQLADITAISAEIDSVQDELTNLNVQLDEAIAAVATLEQTVTDLRNALAAAEGEVAAVQAELDAAIAAADSADQELLDAQAALDDLLFIVSDTCGTVLAVPECDELAAAEQRVADAGTALASANDAVDNLTTTLEQAQADADDLQAQLDVALGDLADAQALVGTLNGAIDDLQQTLDGLIRQLQDLLDDLLALVESIDLDDLSTLVDELVEGLSAGEILGVDQVVVGVRSVADAAGSEATALCSVDGVRVLGQVQAVDTCAQLQDTLPSVTTAITDLLSGLPIAGALPANVVRVAGLTTSTTPADQRQGDYYVAGSTVRALELGVAPIELTQVTDGLVADVQRVIDDVLGQLGTVSLNQAGSVSPSAVDVSALEAALQDLLAQLDGLPTGDLAGVSTPAVSLTGLGTAANANYNAAGTNPAPVTGGPLAGSPIGGIPTTVTPGANLPRTGAAVGLVALLLLGSGAATAHWVRGRRRVVS
ncbi:MAG: hypothetical protein M3N52_13685 [Actinomycetota bacterium]|nr:hypothetical protein [Actinomycetota bacterium]